MPQHQSKVTQHPFGHRHGVLDAGHGSGQARFGETMPRSACTEKFRSLPRAKLECLPAKVLLSLVSEFAFLRGIS